MIESIKNPYWVVIGYSHLFNLNKVCVDGLPFASGDGALRSQHINVASLIDAISIRVIPGPSPSATTPGIMRGVTFASMCTSPRPLKMRTRSPFPIPRALHP
jgi:hypothetical protein